jgi:hypothetical protein
MKKIFFSLVLFLSISLKVYSCSNEVIQADNKEEKRKHLEQEEMKWRDTVLNFYEIWTHSSTEEFETKIGLPEEVSRLDDGSNKTGREFQKVYVLALIILEDEAKKIIREKVGRELTVQEKRFCHLVADREAKIKAVKVI